MSSDGVFRPTGLSAAAGRRILAVTAGCAALAAGALVAVHGVHAGAIGPDVTVHTLTGPGNFAAAGGFESYSLGTVSCNIGDTPLNWCDNNGGCGLGTTDEDHPVIAQNLYRLKDGRFEQVGMSWLKHGFVSTNSFTPDCFGAQGQNCQSPPLGGNQLGVGCTDPYSSSLNGDTPLGMRSEVNAATGAYPFPYTEITPGDTTEQRIRVALADVDPAQNPGALYWLEGQYVAPDDAASENGLNNASHRQTFVNAATFALSFSAPSPTVRLLPAISAWPLMDPEVDLVPVDVPGSAPLERFHVAQRVTDLGGGMWHYEIAVHNLNSDRSARSFTVHYATPATISNPGFHDIDHHSGEPYATTDWTIDLATPDEITWSTDAFATDPDANALRWATMFSFWFDATAGPGRIGAYSLGLFTPGSPGEVVFTIPRVLYTNDFEGGTIDVWRSVAAD